MLFIGDSGSWRANYLINPKHDKLDTNYGCNDYKLKKNE